MTDAEAVDDIVVVADLFELARSDRYKDVDSFRAAARERWEALGCERVDRCIRQLAQKLWDADYFNFRTEYQRQRSRRRKKPAAGTSQSDLS